MKLHRFLFTLAVIAALFAVADPGVAAQRLVLVEGFTQWNCGPCASWNPQERAILEAFTEDTVTSIKYHGWWPGANNDAFYLWNTAENTARINFYGVTWVPWGMCDGIVDMRNVGQALLRNSVRSRYAIPSPCTIALTASSAGETSISFTGTINAEQNMTNASTRLFVALVTDRVTYSSPPGSNGETIFDNPFRDMWPNSSGQSFTLLSGENYEFTGTLNKAAAWNADDLSVVAFVQTTSNKEILQTERVEVSQFYVWQLETTDPGQLIIPVDGGERVYYLDLTNLGINDDTYDVALEGTWPAGWTHTVEASGVPADPDGIQVPLASGNMTTLVVRVNPSGNAGNAEFNVSVTSPNLPGTESTEAFRLMAGLDILVVDDDNGGTRETWYMDALDGVTTDLVYGRWDVAMDILDAAYLDGVELILWFTGDGWQNGTTLTAQDQLMLSDFLDAGGKLFLSGQGIGFDLRTDPFFTDYLHAVYRQNYPGAYSLLGIDSDPISDQLDLTISGGDGANNQTRQSSSDPDSTGLATPVLEWATPPSLGGYPALKVETPMFRIVYLGFGFEAINDATDRVTLMQRSLDWLTGTISADDPQVSLPTEFALGQNFPNPFNPETVIPYTLPERALVTLRVFDVLGREVATLAEGMQEAGAHSLNWNGADLSSGIYFYRLDAVSGDQTRAATRKLMLLK